jgi:hypothetical protein
LPRAIRHRTRNVPADRRTGKLATRPSVPPRGGCHESRGRGTIGTAHTGVRQCASDWRPRDRARPPRLPSRPPLRGGSAVTRSGAPRRSGAVRMRRPLRGSDAGIPPQHAVSRHRRFPSRSRPQLRSLCQDKGCPPGIGEATGHSRVPSSAIDLRARGVGDGAGSRRPRPTRFLAGTRRARRVRRRAAGCRHLTPAGRCRVARRRV